MLGVIWGSLRLVILYALGPMPWCIHEWDFGYLFLLRALLVKTISLKVCYRLLAKFWKKMKSFSDRSRPKGPNQTGEACLRNMSIKINHIYSHKLQCLLWHLTSHFYIIFNCNMISWNISLLITRLHKSNFRLWSVCLVCGSKKPFNHPKHEAYKKLSRYWKFE